MERFFLKLETLVFFSKTIVEPVTPFSYAVGMGLVSLPPRKNAACKLFSFFFFFFCFFFFFFLFFGGVGGRGCRVRERGAG